MKLPDKLYDILKWLVIIVLPACATLYAALASVWGWPFAEQVTTTITAVDTFLGAVLCISAVNYHKEDKTNG
nr:MAG TPA: holin [Caudoviricetes sp.]